MDDQRDDVSTASDQVTTRADELLPEEKVAGSDDPAAQAAAILEDSEERTFDRDAAPGSYVESRTSEDATPPPESAG